MRKAQFQFDVIYIDAAKTKDFIKSELQNAMDLVKPGGIIMGDDWPWPGILTGVPEFVKENKHRLKRIEFKVQNSTSIDDDFLFVYHAKANGQWMVRQSNEKVDC